MIPQRLELPASLPVPPTVLDRKLGIALCVLAGMADSNEARSRQAE